MQGLFTCIQILRPILQFFITLILPHENFQFITSKINDGFEDRNLQSARQQISPHQSYDHTFPCSESARSLESSTCSIICRVATIGTYFFGGIFVLLTWKTRI